MRHLAPPRRAASVSSREVMGVAATLAARAAWRRVGETRLAVAMRAVAMRRSRIRRLSQPVPLPPVPVASMSMSTATRCRSHLPPSTRHPTSHRIGGVRRCSLPALPPVQPRCPLLEQPRFARARRRRRRCRRLSRPRNSHRLPLLRCVVCTTRCQRRRVRRVMRHRAAGLSCAGCHPPQLQRPQDPQRRTAAVPCTLYPQDPQRRGRKPTELRGHH